MKYNERENNKEVSRVVYKTILDLHLPYVLAPSEIIGNNIKRLALEKYKKYPFKNLASQTGIDYDRLISWTRSNGRKIPFYQLILISKVLEIDIQDFEEEFLK